MSTLNHPPGSPALSRWAGGLVVVLSLLPAYRILVLIGKYAVNVPFWDEWLTTVPRYVSDDLTHLALGQFWTLHNEHRMFLPQLVSTGIAELTRLNMIVPLYLNLAIGIAVPVLLYLNYRRHAANRYSALLLLPFSLL